MILKSESQAKARIDELSDQDIYIACDIGVMSGMLGRKGLYAEEDKVMQRYHDILEHYDKKFIIWEDNIRQWHPLKNAFAVMLSGVVTFLSGNRTEASNEPDRCSLDFRVKINKLRVFYEERYRACSKFLTEISERYADLDSLPDIPIPEERREELPDDMAFHMMSLVEKHRINSLPGLVDSLSLLDLPTDSSTGGKPMKRCARSNSR